VPLPSPVRPTPVSPGGLPRTRTRALYADVRAALDRGLSIPDAVWSVVGPDGTRPLARYRRPESGGRGDPRPADVALIARYDSWLEECFPAAQAAAAREAKLKLMAAAAPALETIAAVASNDFRNFVDGDGDPDPRRASVALTGATTLLGMVGVRSARTDDPTPPLRIANQTNIQANVEAGGSVDFGGAIRSLRRRKSPARP